MQTYWYPNGLLAFKVFYIITFLPDIKVLTIPTFYMPFRYLQLYVLQSIQILTIFYNVLQRFPIFYTLTFHGEFNYLNSTQLHGQFIYLYSNALHLIPLLHTLMFTYR